MTTNKRDGLLGAGIFIWPSSARKTERWDWVGLLTNTQRQKPVPFPAEFEGLVGHLRVTLIQNKPAMAGPWKEFYELFPELLEVGKSYLLGTGKIEISDPHGHFIGVRPKNKDQKECMNGKILQSLYGHVVELWFRPLGESETWDGS